ncbi:MAG TPA: YlmC/YmxH family sporulation protein [Bacillota bacterium]|nr:YlmC/YmxH family sporulation protein [Bacillota bacterium]
MQLSELIGKEVINVYDGARLGVVGESDLVVDITTGQIESIILPNRGGVLGFWTDRQSLVIPWPAIKKIGTEVIIVDLDQSHPKFGRHINY